MSSNYVLIVGKWRGGAIETLKDACEAKRTLWVLCKNCGHSDRMDPWQLASKTGRNLSLGELAAKLRCQRCKAMRRAAVVVYDI